MQNMRTTVDIPDELFRRAKSEAALRGRKLKDLVEEGLRLVLEKEKPVPAELTSEKKRLVKPRPGSLHEKMQKFCGIIKDGPPDLSTNPKYFEGFGK
jgi:hypothetical protein